MLQTPFEDELEKDERLGFKEQVAIVRDGIKKGVKFDGCTGVPDFDWGADCCGEHDYHYQMGDVPRAVADANLRKCMQRKGLRGFALAWIYWAGVRIGAGGVWDKYRTKDEKAFNDSSDSAGA